MITNQKYPATNVTQSAIRKRRMELKGNLPVKDICPPAGKLQQIFGDYLDYLEIRFSHEDNVTDIGQVQEMLLELSHCIRSKNSRIKAEEYSAILERLTDIYAQGMAHNRKTIFSATAADYADLIEAISLKHPTYDYSEMIGQLLFYMKQLFEQRKGNWITIYDHLQSMPDSIEGLQSLKKSYLQEIQQWVEEGVENLFQIRADFYSRIEQLNHEASELVQKINAGKDNISSDIAKFKAGGKNTVISFELKSREKEIGILDNKMKEIVIEREGEGRIHELIEENIKEFEDILTNTKRSICIALVYDSSIS